MLSDSDVEQRLSALMNTLSSDARTVVRNPRSTVEPPQELKSGGRALEVLKGLTHDPRAFVEEGVLGQGGMGVVKIARQVALDRPVAVKTLKETRAAGDVEALLAEAWLAGSLEHPGILPIYSLALDASGLPIVVMKRIEGVTWSKLLSGAVDLALYAPGPNRLESHLRVAMQLCNAVHFANARGIVHRDLKPDNVMLGRFGEVYLVDWGIATLAGPSSQFAGTPAYMAPEMLGGEGAVLSAATDVYLLGAVLHEVVTGRPPHLRGTTSELFESVMRSTPVLGDDVPAELASLIGRCMARTPSERPNTALEVRQALEAFLEHQGSRELEQQSALRAAELRAVLQGTPDRVSVSRLFSECRFGFQQALRVWPQNPRAREALSLLTAEVVRFELEHGSAHSAQAVLAELDDPPAALVEAVAKAEAAEREKEAEHARLQRLAHSVDPLTGSRLRMVLAVSLGTMWMLSPLVLGLYHSVFPDHDETLLTLPITLVSLVVTLAVMHKTPRERRTPLNVQIAHLLVFGMAVQFFALLYVKFVLGGLGVHTIAVLEFHWFMMAGMIASTIVPQIWPAAAGFLTAMLLTVQWPQWRYGIGTLGNSVLLLNMIVVFVRQSRALTEREAKASATSSGGA